MKKSLVATLLFVVSATTAFGQFAPPIDTVFTENFDGALGADSIAANYNTDSLNAIRTWNDTSFLSTTGSSSFHTQIYASDSIIFETDAFSTVTYTNVRFTFDHICKIRFIQKAYMQMSRDNGATWVNLTGSEYKGSLHNLRVKDGLTNCLTLLPFYLLIGRDQLLVITIQEPLQPPRGGQGKLLI